MIDEPWADNAVTDGRSSTSPSDTHVPTGQAISREPDDISSHGARGEVACSACGGTGATADGRCPECDGTGRELAAVGGG